MHNIILAACDDTKQASLYDLAMMLSDPKRGGDIKQLFQEMMDTEHDKMLLQRFPDMLEPLAVQIHNFVAQKGAEMMAKAAAEQELSGVVSQVTSNLGLYGDPVVGENTRKSDFRLHDLMNSDEAVNLYLIVPPSDIDRLKPLLRIFISQLLGRLTEKMEFADGATKQQYKHRMLLLMDEFTSLGKLAIVERAIAYMAGYGVKGYFIVQDTKQLNQAYGQDNALMANCHVRIAYAPNLPETAEYLSKLAGQMTVVQKKKSRSTGKGGGSVSTNVEEVGRALITPDECLRIPGIQKRKKRVGLFKTKTEIIPGKMLIFVAGHPPIKGTQILYFKDPELSRRSKFKPYFGNSMTGGSGANGNGTDGEGGVEREYANNFWDDYFKRDLPDGINPDDVPGLGNAA